MPAKRTINKLTRVKTDELSLVKNGANNKLFAFTKEHTMDFQKLLQTVMTTVAEGEVEMVKVLKAAGASAETIEIATANFRLQAGFADKLSKSEFAVVAKAAGYTLKAAAKKEEDEDKEEDEAFPGAAPPFDKKKTAKEIEEEKKAAEKKAALAKSSGLPESVQKALDDSAAEMVIVKKEAADAKSEVTALRKSGELRDYIEKCKENYLHVPGAGSVEEMGATLQKAYEVSDDFGKKLEKQWAATSEAISKSVLLVKAGGNSVSNSDAHTQLKKIAKGFMAADAELTEPAAFVKAMDENSALYDEYLEDNPSQV